MTPIIITPRRTLPLLLDGAMTCAAWAALIGLCLSELPAAWPLAATQAASDPLAALEPALQTLVMYLLVGSFNALLMTLWSRYHLSHARARRPAAPCDIGLLASHFHVSGSQLSAVQDSRMATIHHADSGSITGIVLEPDPLETARAAASGAPRGIQSPIVLGHPADVRRARLAHETDMA
ncbi:poly-beta-1,6-N-acetyl-D-glucosamine biosynthesis protein PgaD [Castellaniella sp. GW247-6E4]|uniref:poly-beta-1,6-N-acetyl-D-glucosamine biosynthesis protein PgaD n=1 Tax=Castellaniella sp. GW247-6E4 TaxID=3140380 RepID=UPI0033149EA5